MLYLWMDGIHGMSLVLNTCIDLAALGLSCCLGGQLSPHASSVAPEHVWSSFPDQGSHLHPWHCKVNLLTSGPQGRSLHVCLWAYTKENCWCPLGVCIAQLCPTLCDPMGCISPGSSVHGDSPGKNMEWVAISSSRGSSQSRDRTQVVRIAGRLLTVWATRKALYQGNPLPGDALLNIKCINLSW